MVLVNEVAYDYYIALDNVDFTTNPDIVPSASNKFLKVITYSETSKQVNDYLVFNDATQAEELILMDLKEMFYFLKATIL